jgi:hypothetical protein
VPQFFTVGTTALPFGPLPAVVTNTASSGTLYFGGPAVSSSSNNYSLAAGATRTIPRGSDYVVASLNSISALVQDPPGVPVSEAGNVTAPAQWSNHNPILLTGGTTSTPVAGTVYYQPIQIPVSCQLTGIQYLIGTVGGTDSVIAGLYDDKGNVLGSSLLAGTVVGTTATVQKLALLTPYQVTGPGLYHVSLSFNGNTARYMATSGATFVNSASATGSFGTLAAITPPTTAGAAGTCAIVSTY